MACESVLAFFLLLTEVKTFKELASLKKKPVFTNSNLKTSFIGPRYFPCLGICVEIVSF